MIGMFNFLEIAEKLVFCCINQIFFANFFFFFSKTDTNQIGKKRTKKMTEMFLAPITRANGMIGFGNGSTNALLEDQTQQQQTIQSEQMRKKLISSFENAIKFYTIEEIRSLLNGIQIKTQSSDVLINNLFESIRPKAPSRLSLKIEPITPTIGMFRI